jgi:hypothetical protein
MKMLLKNTCLHCLALLLMLPAADIAFAQTPVVAPPPLPWKVDPLGLGATLGPPCAENQDSNGSLLIGDPLLDGGAAPGWVAGIEVGIVGPHVENRLVDSVTRASGATDTVHLPTAELGIQGMPKVELGYRWGQATGELILSWTSLSADATQQFSGSLLPAFGPAGAPVSSRLNLQVFDLDYGSHEPLTVFGVDMKWRAGVRGLLYYSDSQAANDTLFQHVVNNYWGVGPHAMADFRRRLGATGLDLFARFDASVVFGRVTQRFVETVTTGGTIDSGETDQFNNVQSLMLGLQAGVRWTPLWNPNFHVTAAYGAQVFQGVGTVFAQPSPTETLRIQGCFLRAEWNY